MYHEEDSDCHVSGAGTAVPVVEDLRKKSNKQAREVKLEELHKALLLIL